MKKRSRILAGLLCGMLLAAGCKVIPETEKNPPAGGTQTVEDVDQGKLNAVKPSAYSNVNGLNLEPGTTLSIIGKGKSSAYWSEVKRGAEEAVADINKRLGYKGEDKVSLTYSAPKTEEDVDDQVNILDEELARYPAALGIAAVDASACEVQFDLAAENGIPIVAFDSGTDYRDIVAMVDTDNAEASSMAVNRLCDSIGDSGKVLMLVHDSMSTSAKQREEGFVKALTAKKNEVSVAGIYRLDELEDMQKQIAKEQNPDAEEDTEAKTDAETDADTGDRAEENLGADITQEEVVKYLLEKNPDVKGIYTTNETTTKLAVQVLEELGRTDVKVVAFDGGADQMKLLEEEKVEALVVQNPYGIGYATVVACARAVLDQGNEATINTGFALVTRDNMEDASIKKMMY